MKKEVQKKHSLKKDVKAKKASTRSEKGMATGAAAPIKPKKTKGW